MPTSDVQPGTWVSLYRSMLTAREVDESEQRLVAQGLAHFHVAGAGHEASAALAPNLRSHDWLHLHYRDKALLIARGLPLEAFFRQQLAKATCYCSGRQLPGIYYAPDLHVSVTPSRGTTSSAWRVPVVTPR
jgi:2-oxoisovalerate dehydrogenase E1 component